MHGLHGSASSGRPALEIRYLLERVTPEELEAFLSQTPPRRVPANIRHNAFSRGCLSGCVLAFGVLWCAMSLIAIFIVPFPWRLGDELRLDLGSPETAEGRVLSVERVAKRLHRARFRFGDAGGGSHVGVCYLSKPRRRGRAGKVSLKPGEPATVEYLAGDPGACRIRGWTVNSGGYFALLFLPVLLVGPAIVILSWSRRRGALRLLVNGRAARGRIAAGSGTEWRGAGAPGCSFSVGRAHHAVVAFEASGSEVSVAYFGASQHERRVIARLAASGEPVRVLYDPERPRRILLADALVASGEEAEEAPGAQSPLRP